MVVGWVHTTFYTTYFVGTLHESYDILDVFGVETPPHRAVLGQFLLPHKFFPHPLGYNVLGKSAKECGDTVW